MGARPKKEQVPSNPLIRLLNRWLLTLLLTLIAGYRYLLSPLIGQHCRFHPTCSAFAQEALILHGPWRGSWLTLGRLARCHPWADGGLDPVPGHTPSQPCDKTDTH